MSKNRKRLRKQTKNVPFDYVWIDPDTVQQGRPGWPRLWMPRWKWKRLRKQMRADYHG